MCIIYHSSFAHCQHKDFLGSYHCGREPGCVIEAQHIFDAEDAGFPCETCLLLDKMEMPPVEYYPPVPDIQLALVKRPGWAWPEIVVMGEGGGGVDLTGPQEGKSCRGSCAGSLSDVDSVTSYWRLDPAGKVECVNARDGLDEDAYEIDGGSDDTALPGGFVRSPAHLANSPAPIFGISPNTAKHRTLVQDQLAALPHPDPFPTHAFAESPQRMTTPALRTTFQPTFEPRLPAGLPSYPVLPPGLINYPAYPAGMTGEHFPTMHQGSPTRARPMMGTDYMPGLRAGHGPPPMTGDHYPALREEPTAQNSPVNRRSPYKYAHTPATRPNLIFGGQAANANPMFNVMPTAPYGMGVNTPATGNTLFNMGTALNDPAHYGTPTPMNMGGNMAGFAFNPLAPQFTGTPTGKGKARWSPRKDGF